VSVNRTSPDPPLTVGDLRSQVVEHFRAAGVEESETKADWLIAEAISCSRLEVPLQSQQPVGEEAVAQVWGWAGRVEAREPLQYVLGTISFMGHSIRTDRRALIPRPETEQLVEKVMESAGLGGLAGPVVGDVGTGSGCIAIALASAYSRLRVWALDISAEALALAGENVEAHCLGGQIRLRESHLCAAWPGGVRADVIVSNPPYVDAQALPGLQPEVRDWEPAVALAGGTKGLAVIERLVPQARAVLRPAGRLYLEIGEDQGEAVEALVRRSGFFEVAVHLDLAGHPRIVQGKKT
jgi:release factor glutamine methyltransferase